MMIWQNYLETYFPILPHNWYVQLKIFPADHFQTYKYRNAMVNEEVGHRFHVTKFFFPWVTALKHCAYQLCDENCKFSQDK